MVAFDAYAPDMASAVLGLLRSNVPDYFAASEEEDLAETLADPDGPLWVMRLAPGGPVIGFGGFEVGSIYNRVVLTWGMVGRAWHGQGHGRRLLAWRAAQAWAATGGDTRWLVVDTTPIVAPFYRRCGFDLVEVWPEGYRAGFDMQVLRMEFGGTAMQGLLSHLPPETRPSLD